MDKRKITLKNTWLHFKKVCTHKRWVFHYCCKCGIIWRGIKHDMSKFSPTEFWESVRYYQGDRSPIDACKEENGVSAAWMHHKGRNTHHYEYWQDDFDHGGKPVIMPFEDALEMLCDYLGAGRAYMGKKFTYRGELEWWKKKTNNALAMHPMIKEFISQSMRMCENGFDFLDKMDFKLIYDKLEREYKGIVKEYIVCGYNSSI